MKICLESYTMSILINDNRTLTPTKELRQEEPLNPFLFLIVEGLS